MAKNKSNLRVLLEEILEHILKQNYSEHLKDHQREIDLLKGNLEQEIKMRRAMERYLKLTYELEAKYKKNDQQTHKPKADRKGKANA